MRLPPLLATIAFPIFAHTSTPQDPLLHPADTPTCPSHTYTTTLLSLSPLLIHISPFLHPTEIHHLQDTLSPEFTRSHIADSDGHTHDNASTRTSSSASLSSRDDVIRCIEARAMAFQGLGLGADTNSDGGSPRRRMEPLQLVRYGKGEGYHEHTDWFTSDTQTGKEVGGNRVSSFFAYVEVSKDIVGGGTRFPFVDAPGAPKSEGLGTGLPGWRRESGGKGRRKGEEEEEWLCEIVDCDEAWENGVTVRPREGDAVFWVNLLGQNGRGDERTLHAGLGVRRGRKMGMNVWTREGRIADEFWG